MTRPYFSILILTWNDARYLPACLESLAAQTFTDFEVLLLDNGSTTPIPQDLLTQYSTLRLSLQRSETNLGFAGGNNLLAGQALGQYLALLNADAFPSPGWLESLHEASLRFANTFFASRLLKADDPQQLDGEWNIYHASGMAWRRNHDQPLSRASKREQPAWGACAAAGVYPREAFLAVGGFDEDFFAYMEDIDLDFRLRLQGVQCVYLPQAVVRHVGSGSTSSHSDLAVFHGQRNLVWTFVKDMPGALFWLLLPAHLVVNIIYLVAALFVPFGKQIARGKWHALQGLPRMWAKRKQVQSTRKVSAWQIARHLDWNPFSPLIKLTFK
jgi:GT2 family glycosyltransferase